MSLPKTTGKTRRVVALDGLRGLAALLVVIGHTIGALRAPPGVAAPSVILFFVLSGYCLSSSALRGDRAVDRAQFLVRRIFRIHPPFVFALLFAWTVSLTAEHAPCCDGLSGWILNFNYVSLAPQELVRHMFFPGTAGNQMPVGWTLKVEMVFSLLFPVMLWLSRRIHWTVLLGIALLGLLHDRIFYTGQVYAIHFVAGILVYEAAARLESFSARAPHVLSVFVVAVAIYFTAIGMSAVPASWNVLAWVERVKPWSSISIALALSSSALTIGAVHVPWMRRWLEWKSVRFLGRVSYSVYLLHFTVLLLLLRTVERRLSDLEVAGMVAVVVIVTVGLAAAMYRLVELPSIRLGNLVCARIAELAHGEKRFSRIAVDQ